MNADSEESGRVLVGTAGWSYPDWEGIVYPPNMPKSTHPLSFLSRWFDAVEVNSSFYRQPDARHAAAWLCHVSDNPRFKFSFKLWQGFTHEKNEWPGDGEVRRYVAGILPLLDARRLGAVLVQFPWSFRRTVEARRHLARIAEAFEGLPLTVEVRHVSWDVPEFYDSLKKLGMAFCAIDQPALHDCLPPSDLVTAPLGYVRLHGRNAEQWFREGAGRDQRYNYLYNTDDLDVWIERMRGMRKKVKEMFVITNNHYRGQAVVNALEMQAALGTLREQPPPWLISHFPRLQEIACGIDQ